MDSSAQIDNVKSDLAEASMQAVAGSRVMAAAPNAAMVHDIYPGSHVQDAETHLAEKIVYRGKQRITTNSLSLDAQSNFQITDSNIVEGLTLNGSITMNATTAIPRYGWALDAVSSIELTFGAGNISNITLNGRLLKEYALLCCRSAEEREELLERCGSPVAGGTVGFFSMPITHIIFGLLGHESNYPLDMGALSGNIQININWRPASGFVEGPGVTSLSAFTSLNMSMVEVAFADSKFSMSSMQRKAALPYIVPIKNQVHRLEPVSSYTPGTEFSINLQSLPDGHLVGLLLYLEVPAWVSSGAAEDLYPSSLDVKAVRLSVDNVDLINFTSEEEKSQYYAECMDGDSLRYNLKFGADGAVAGGAYTALVTRALRSQVCYLPLTYHARETLELLQENSPDYSNNNLTLSLTTKTQAELTEYANATPFRATASTRTAVGTALNVRIAYIVSGALDIQRGNVQLVV
jgi:hypothetical protein